MWTCESTIGATSEAYSFQLTCHPIDVRVTQRSRVRGALRAPRRQSLLPRYARPRSFPRRPPAYVLSAPVNTVIAVSVAAAQPIGVNARGAEDTTARPLGQCGRHVRREAPIMRGVAAERSAYARSAGAATGGGGRAALP